MRQALRAVHAREITWAEFYKRTARDWSRLARFLFVKWRLPRGVEAADIEQQLMLEAFLAAGTWKAGGMPIDEYVVWVACSKTKRWIHEQRNAKRRDAKARSRMPVLFADMLEPDESGAPVEPEFPVAAAQENVIACFELLVAALHRLNVLSRQLLFVVVDHGGSVDLAAEDVYERAELRRVYRWDSVSDARSEIRSVVQSVAAAA